MTQPVSMTDDVKAVFDAMSEDVRPVLLEMRDLVFDTAMKTDETGELVETLKWGQPSYLTVRPKSGSTIRLGISKSGRPALFCHCQTSLVSQFQELYPQLFDFEGNRAMVIRDDIGLPRDELSHCIALALTYHKRKRS
ncbi:MAG: DUF1801 domain-containing protein [Alphaproteobacteria bacterium]|nr:DUF1801 domain-containing protein [Alphaproteobacteria bacterium]